MGSYVPFFLKFLKNETRRHPWRWLTEQKKWCITGLYAERRLEGG
jgi:hypothetical protein